MSYGQLDIIQNKELSFEKDNLTGISTNKINEGDNKIWISTEAGVHIYDGDKCRNIFFGSKPSLHSLESVRDIVHHSETTKFFIYDRDVPFVDRFDMVKNQIDSIPISVSNNRSLIDIISQNNQDVWGVSQDMDSLFFTSVTDRKASFGLRKNEISKVIKVVSSKEGFWVIDDTYHFYYISETGLERRAIRTPTTFKNSDFHPTRMVLQEDRAGRLWWGPFNQSKVMVLARQDSVFRAFKNFETKLNFYKLWEDEVGNLIFAFSRSFGYTTNFFLLDKDGEVEDWSALKEYSSICRQISSRDFRNYLICGSFRNTFILKQALFGVHSFLKNEEVNGGSLSNNIIRGFSEIDSNTVLVATEADEWYRYNCETNEITTSSISPKCTYTNLSKSNGVVWFTSCFDGTSNYFYLAKYNPVVDKVSKYDCGFSLGSIFVDDDKIICIGKKEDELRMAIFNIENETMDPLVFEPSFETAFRFRFYKCYKFGEYYWLGTNNGLYKVKVNHQNRSAQITTTKLSVDNHKVFEIQAVSNQLLLSTERGIIFYDPKTEKTRTYDKSNGLSNSVACAAILTGGHIWVPTFIGLNILDTISHSTGLLLETDGISDDEFNTGAALKTKNGKMYFGTANGMVVVDSAQFYKNGLDFNIGVSSYSQTSKNQEIKSYSYPNEHLHFSGPKSVFYQFKLFSIDDFFHPNTTKYYYRNSSNPNEIIPINGQLLYLSGLPYGKNDLTIFGISKHGFRSNNTIQLSVNVSRAFYEGWWFIPLCFLIGTLFLFQVAYTIGHRRRTKQEQHKRKVAQLELSVLQAQLNPHFIFNSLSGIQNCLHNSNLQMADRYIAEFAQLMRLFLESSKKKFITIFEEVDLLKKYTEMEKRRFENRFDIEFKMDPEIDANNSIIPTFLLQPFVENAINHGLFHKKEKGVLKISFVKYGISKLRISIEDNGVGREAVKEYQTKSYRKHKSRAGQIIQEKSEVLRAFDNYIIDINTIDLTDSSGNPTGTRVNIDIPELE